MGGATICERVDHVCSLVDGGVYGRMARRAGGRGCLEEKGRDEKRDVMYDWTESQKLKFVVGDAVVDLGQSSF